MENDIRNMKFGEKYFISCPKCKKGIEYNDTCECGYSKMQEYAENFNEQIKKARQYDGFIKFIKEDAHKINSLICNYIIDNNMCNNSTTCYECLKVVIENLQNPKEDI